MPTAIVLSGGGAQGDFQVGALRFLYDQEIRPDIIAGSSVGAINGTKLAEGEGAPDQGLADLEALWLEELRTNDNMYLTEDWVNNLPVEARGVITGDGAPATEDPQFFDFFAAAYPQFFPLIKQAYESLSDAVAGQVMKRLSNENSIFNLEPIRWQMVGNPALGIRRRFDRAKLDAWSGQGGHSRLAMVCLEPVW
jgi:NTE family protein